MSEIAPTSGEFIVFLPAGGATAGQWPINRPNIAGLGLQQNEDSIRNHLINEHEQDWVYSRMRILSGIISLMTASIFQFHRKLALILKLVDSRIIT